MGSDAAVDKCLREAGPRAAAETTPPSALAGRRPRQDRAPMSGRQGPPLLYACGHTDVRVRGGDAAMTIKTTTLVALATLARAVVGCGGDKTDAAASASRHRASAAPPAAATPAARDAAPPSATPRPRPTPRAAPPAADSAGRRATATAGGKKGAPRRREEAREVTVAADRTRGRVDGHIIDDGAVARPPVPACRVRPTAFDATAAEASLALRLATAA